MFSAPTEKGGITSHEIGTFAFSLCSPRGRKAGLVVFGVFLKMELCWSPKRELYLVSNSEGKGSLHLMGVLIFWLFFLGLGDQKTGDALGVGAGREGQIDRGFMRWQNT